MGHADAGCLPRPAQFPEPSVTQPAGRHLNRLAAARRFGPRVERAHVQRHSKLPTQIAHKLLVAIALRSAQMEIAVCRLQPAAQPDQQAQQAHAVGPAAQGHEQQAVGEQGFAPDEIAHP